MRRLGAHLSIGGGLDKAVERTVAIGGNCLQIFSGSPRGWQMKLPSKEEAERFKNLCIKHDVKPIFIHAKYLVNLASDKKRLVNISVKSLVHDLKAAKLIGAKGVIVHLGSHQGRGWQRVKAQVLREIKAILQASPKGVELIIENTAGEKGKIPSHLEEIGLILKSIRDRRLSWCLDSCHAYAAGYSLGKSWGNTLIENDIFKAIKKAGILKQLVCLHVNDSKGKIGSHIDRHADLGKGEIGLEGLKVFVNQPQVKHLPMIIETPGNGAGPDKKNLDILKRLVK